MEVTYRLYSQQAIAIATFFGGPFAAGLLIRRNSLNLGREKEGLYALIIGFIAMFLLVWGLYMLPENILDRIPNALFPMIYTGIIYFIVHRLHGKILDNHKSEGLPFYSNWKAAGIGFVSLIVIAAVFLVPIYLTSENWDHESYSQKMEQITENETQALKFFDMENSYGYEIVHFIEHTGLPKWKENIEHINAILAIEDLPEEVRKETQMLREYTDLRIRSYELISKAISEATDEYAWEIEKIHLRIKELLDLS